MIQAIAETVFDVLYLGFAIVSGCLMLCRGKGPLAKNAGLMTVLLGAGDAFHLVPRAWALWTTGLEAHAAALGIGKFVTSITMTVFYLLLYYIWKTYFQVRSCKSTTAAMWILAAARVILCLLPQNQWLTYQQPLLFGILRNLPFAAMGIWMICLFAREVHRSHDRIFRFMPLAIGLSFGFYLPVVLFSGVAPMVGMLMIPKTLAYVWIILMCRQLVCRR